MTVRDEVMGTINEAIEKIINHTNQWEAFGANVDSELSCLQPDKYRKRGIVLGLLDTYKTRKRNM